MLSRLSSVPRRVVSVRHFSILDKVVNDPKAHEKAAQILDDPKLMNEAMSQFNTIFKENGGGMMGALLRNSPIKGALDKMGGIENLEKLMQDPAAMARVRDMMKNPAMVAQAQEQMKKAFGKKDGEA